MHETFNGKRIQNDHHLLESCVKKPFAKIVDPTTMVELKNDVVVTLILLEKEFPPFFNTMTHLLVHLVEELEICGLLHMH
jgi:hypothetical protein